MAESGAVDPAERGRTVIEDAVFERIATRAATEVPGVAGVGSGLDKVMGRALPKAEARVAGSRARVRVEIAVTWPHPLPSVAATVRDHVTTRLTELTGASVDGVDVDVTRVIQASEPQRRRVR